MLFSLAAIGSICFAATLLAAEAIPLPSSIGPHVRGATPAVNEMLATGIRRSATFARLVRDIDDSDIIVYVEITTQMPPGLDGRLTFLTAAGGYRYLRIQVLPNTGKHDLIAVVGHELQHALEIAANPRVRDSEGVTTLYRLIGLQMPGRDRYDTTAARSMGRRVRAELPD
ncbi:MAG: hypothetical protein M3541_21865 [Acidobacteriota bacterium]|nr:hypothetical protein [Acidobacteriota bacterium]